MKDRGLWALFLDKELGGPGFGQLKLALLNEILGRYRSAPAIFGTAAPDTGNMEMLAAYGTPEQKDKWLYPLMNQELFSAYSVARGKPHPDLFLHAAATMGADPGGCVVVEDTASGVTAAVSAGMRVIGYGADSDELALRRAGAELMGSMQELPALLGL